MFFLFKLILAVMFFFFFSSRRRHTRSTRDWSSDVCSSDLSGVDLGGGDRQPEAEVAQELHALGDPWVEQVGGPGDDVRPPEAPVLLDHLLHLGRALRQAEQPGERDGEGQDDRGADGLRLGHRPRPAAQGLESGGHDHLGRVDQRPVQVEDDRLEHRGTVGPEATAAYLKSRDGKVSASSNDQKRSPLTLVTPSYLSRRPSTTSSALHSTGRRFRSKVGGSITMLEMPVSSSSERKTNPFAVPGRWRTMHSPPARTRCPLRILGSSAALRTPSRRNLSLSSDTGCCPTVIPVPRKSAAVLSLPLISGKGDAIVVSQINAETRRRGGFDFRKKLNLRASASPR